MVTYTLPSPTGIGRWQGALGAQLWGGAWQLGPWQLHPMSLLFAASGTAMISKTLRIPKF